MILNLPQTDNSTFLTLNSITCAPYPDALSAANDAVRFINTEALFY